jgi:hypothetical protein
MHGVGDIAERLGLSLVLDHVAEARRGDQEHREDEQGGDRLGFVAQHWLATASTADIG